MGSFNARRWIDFGDFGQHEAEVSGKTGDFGAVTSVRVTHKGETLELVRMLPREYEGLILEEAEIDERDYYRDMAEGRAVDEAVERMVGA